MRGIERFNFDAFDHARDRLIAGGWEVVSPADLDRAVGFDPDGPLPEGFVRDAMRRDVEALLTCDAIYLLRGWHESEGATLELHIGAALGLEVLHEAGAVHPGEWGEEDIADEARRLVYGDRGESYGPPQSDFERSGRIMGAVLGIPDVPPEKVALCMIGIKMSREVHRPKRDNRTDLIGYTLCLDRIHNEHL